MEDEGLRITVGNDKYYEKPGMLLPSTSNANDLRNRIRPKVERNEIFEKGTIAKQLHIDNLRQVLLRAKRAEENKLDGNLSYMFDCDSSIQRCSEKLPQDSFCGSHMREYEEEKAEHPYDSSNIRPEHHSSKNYESLARMYSHCSTNNPVGLFSNYSSGDQCSRSPSNNVTKQASPETKSRKTRQFHHRKPRNRPLPWMNGNSETASYSVDSKRNTNEQFSDNRDCLNAAVCHSQHHHSPRKHTAHHSKITFEISPTESKLTSRKRKISPIHFNKSELESKGKVAKTTNQEPIIKKLKGNVLNHLKTDSVVSISSTANRSPCQSRELKMQDLSCKKESSKSPHLKKKVETTPGQPSQPIQKVKSCNQLTTSPFRKSEQASKSSGCVHQSSQLKLPTGCGPQTEENIKKCSPISEAVPLNNAIFSSNPTNIKESKITSGSASFAESSTSIALQNPDTKQSASNSKESAQTKLSIIDKVDSKLTSIHRNTLKDTQDPEAKASGQPEQPCIHTCQNIVHNKIKPPSQSSAPKNLAPQYPSQEPTLNFQEESQYTSQNTCDLDKNVKNSLSKFAPKFERTSDNTNLEILPKTKVSCQTSNCPDEDAPKSSSKIHKETMEIAKNSSKSCQTDLNEETEELSKLTSTSSDALCCTLPKSKVLSNYDNSNELQLPFEEHENAVLSQKCLLKDFTKAVRNPDQLSEVVSKENKTSKECNLPESFCATDPVLQVIPDKMSQNSNTISSDRSLLSEDSAVQETSSSVPNLNKEDNQTIIDAKVDSFSESDKCSERPQIKSCTSPEKKAQVRDVQSMQAMFNSILSKYTSNRLLERSRKKSLVKKRKHCRRKNKTIPLLRNRLDVQKSNEVLTKTASSALCKKNREKHVSQSIPTISSKSSISSVISLPVLPTNVPQKHIFTSQGCFPPLQLEGTRQNDYLPSLQQNFQSSVAQKVLSEQMSKFHPSPSVSLSFTPPAMPSDMPHPPQCENQLKNAETRIKFLKKTPVVPIPSNAGCRPSNLVSIKLDTEEDYKSRRIEYLEKELEKIKQQQIDMHSKTVGESKIKFDEEVGSEPGLRIDSCNSFEYDYFDPGNHCCKECSLCFATLQEYLVHLHSLDHGKHMDSKTKPWKKKVENKQHKKKELLAPLNGSEFMHPVVGFYCKLCDCFSADLVDGEDHCKDQQHNTNSLKYVQSNPEYDKKRRKLFEKIKFKEEIKRKRRATETVQDHHIIDSSRVSLANQISIGSAPTEQIMPPSTADLRSPNLAFKQEESSTHCRKQTNRTREPLSSNEVISLVEDDQSQQCRNTSIEFEHHRVVSDPQNIDDSYRTSSSDVGSNFCGKTVTQITSGNIENALPGPLAPNLMYCLPQDYHFQNLPVLTNIAVNYDKQTSGESLVATAYPQQGSDAKSSNAKETLSPNTKSKLILKIPKIKSFIPAIAVEPPRSHTPELDETVTRSKMVINAPNVSEKLPFVATLPTNQTQLAPFVRIRPARTQVQVSDAYTVSNTICEPLITRETGINRDYKRKSPKLVDDSKCNKSNHAEENKIDLTKSTDSPTSCHFETADAVEARLKKKHTSDVPISTSLKKMERVKRKKSKKTTRETRSDFSTSEDGLLEVQSLASAIAAESSRAAMLNPDSKGEDKCVDVRNPTESVNASFLRYPLRVQKQTRSNIRQRPKTGSLPPPSVSSTAISTQITGTTRQLRSKTKSCEVPPAQKSSAATVTEINAKDQNVTTSEAKSGKKNDFHSEKDFDSCNGDTMFERLMKTFNAEN